MAKDNKKTSTKKEKNIKKVQKSLKNGGRKNTHNISRKKTNNIAIKKDKVKVSSSIKEEELVPKKKVKESPNGEIINNKTSKTVRKAKRHEEKKDLAKEPIAKVDEKEGEALRIEKTIKISRKIVDEDEIKRIEKTIAIKKVTDEEVAKEQKEIEISDESKKEEEISKEESKEETKKQDKQEKLGKTEKIKKISKKIITNVKEKTKDDNFFIDDAEDYKKKRLKKYLRESIFFAVMITLINLVAMKIFSYANYLKLFDIKWVNIALTVVLSLIFSYAVSIFIDCIVSELWIKYQKKKQKKGAQDGDKGTKEGKHPEDF